MTQPADRLDLAAMLLMSPGRQGGLFAGGSRVQPSGVLVPDAADRRARRQILLGKPITPALTTALARVAAGIYLVNRSPLAPPRAAAAAFVTFRGRSP
jgi:hypothetical protein